MKSILFLRTSLFLLIALLAINLGASAQSIIAVPAKPPVSSPVKAKITPKKKVSQKRTVAPSTKKISKRTANSDVTTHKISDTQSDTNQSFFPIYGITLGLTTKNDIVKMGYKPELYENGPKWHVDVNNVKFWDFKGDGVIKDMYLLEYGTMPQKWVDLGMDLTMSYNKWMTFLRKYRFEVTESNIPQVVEYSGRQTLSADVTASNKQLQIQIHLDFDYGNDHGDGYTKDSKNTLYQVSFKSLK